jgi:DNA-binding NtrC family response regulator
VDTAEAMAAALADPRWELVLSDYQVPGFGGMAALRALQATELDIPFILVSGAIGEDVAVAAVKAGAHGYVLKDNLVRLCSAVERELKDALARREQRQAKADLLRSEEQRRQMEATLRDLDRLSTRSTTPWPGSRTPSICWSPPSPWTTRTATTRI